MNTPWHNPGDPHTAFLRAEEDLRQKAVPNLKTPPQDLLGPDYKTSANTLALIPISNAPAWLHLWLPENN
jgi:hypothetical protein